MTLTIRGALALSAALALGHEARAQALAARIGAVRDGTVELRFASRRGVCGDGRRYASFGGRTRMGDFRGNVERDGPCVPGPVRVRLQMENGAVRRVRAYAGPIFAPGSGGEPATDLGAVPAREAAAYFLELASGGEGRASVGAILPAVLADSVSVWRSLLAISRDRTRSRGTRTDAAIWLSRFAAAKLEGHEEDLVASEVEREEDETDARTAAVFALSQLRHDEGIVPLVQVARTSRDAGVRRAALFWLGESGDARGLDLMEEILTR